MARRRLTIGEVRDWLFLGVGLGGITYEAGWYSGPPRWPLLVVYLTLLGLPSAIGLDALREKFRDGPPGDPDRTVTK